MSYERLGAVDAAFLHIEAVNQPQHVGSLALVEGASFFDADGRFKLAEARRIIAGRLHLVPRFRKRILEVPLQQGRPVWVDDEHFDLSYHVRHTALPAPGSEQQLLALMERIQSQLLDRRRPLWELWFVEGVSDGRVAIIQKTHHCLVDGISGVDVATVLLDLEPDPPRMDEPVPWHPTPGPTATQLLVESMVERAVEPTEVVRSLRAMARGPKQAWAKASDLAGYGLQAARRPAAMPWNVPISPQRRFTTARVPVARVRAIKDAATETALTAGRCSINDVVLAACAGGLRRYLDHLGEEAAADIRVMVPVSMRSEDERGVLGNRVSMVPADLPVAEDDPRWRLRYVHEQMRSLKESGMAVAGDELLQMTNYLPPTIFAVASRLMVRSRPVNTVITNVPGPQFPLYCMGGKVLEAFPYVQIVDNMALSVAVLSFNGQFGFGITTDRDVPADPDVLAEALEDAVLELAEALGVGEDPAPEVAPRATPPTPAAAPATPAAAGTKAPAKRAAVKKAAVKRAAAKKAVTKKAPAKKAPAKKAPAKKAVTKKVAAKRAPAKRAPAKKAGVQPTAAKRTAQQATPGPAAPAPDEG